jgi:hypothetical protein
MNIFFLSKDPYLAATYHCDKHVVKMIVETCQMLCSVHFRHGTHQSWMYKPTHQKHPSTLWAGNNLKHYLWLKELGLELCREYTNRYGKVHKCQELLDHLKPPLCLESLEWIDPPQCMPDECKQQVTTKAYQEYYRHKKSIMSMKWYRDLIQPPTWMAV